MIIFIRDSDGTNLIDCEIFTNGSGNVTIKTTIDKKCKLDLVDFNSQVKTLNGVSNVDDGLNEVCRALKRTLQNITKDSPELSLIED